MGVGVGRGRGLRLPNNYFLYPVRCCPALADGAYKPEFAGYIYALRTRRYAMLCYAIKESKVISVAVPPVAVYYTPKTYYIIVTICYTPKTYYINCMLHHKTYYIILTVCYTPKTYYIILTIYYTPKTYYIILIILHTQNLLYYINYILHTQNLLYYINCMLHTQNLSHYLNYSSTYFSILSNHPSPLLCVYIIHCYLG